MLSIGLWWWYINITITILHIIHRPVSYLKHNILETEFFLRRQVEPTQMGPLEAASLCLWSRDMPQFFRMSFAKADFSGTFSCHCVLVLTLASSGAGHMCGLYYPSMCISRGEPQRCPAFHSLTSSPLVSEVTTWWHWPHGPAGISGDLELWGRGQPSFLPLRRETLTDSLFCYGKG
jgi:hypothetical protein